MSIIDTVKKHPYLSAGAVFAVGLILVLALAGGNSDSGTTVVTAPSNDAVNAAYNAQISTAQIGGQVSALNISAARDVAIDTNATQLAGLRSQLEVTNNKNVLDAYSTVHAIDGQVSINATNVAGAVTINASNNAAAVSQASIAASTTNHLADVAFQTAATNASIAAYMNDSNNSAAISMNANNNAAALAMGYSDNSVRLAGISAAVTINQDNNSAIIGVNQNNNATALATSQNSNSAMIGLNQNNNATSLLKLYANG